MSGDERKAAPVGGFTISTRLPGETARDANRRRKRERRELEARELASGK